MIIALIFDGWDHKMRLDDYLLLFILFFVFMLVVFLGAGLLMGYVSIWVFLLGAGYIVSIIWVISRKVEKK